MSEFYELPEDATNPSLQRGIFSDTSLEFYPRLLIITNGFTAPDNGVVVAQVVGIGSILSIQIDGFPFTPYNASVALASGAIYEFDIHVREGEQVYVDPTTCAIRALFFRRGK